MVVGRPNSEVALELRVDPAGPTKIQWQVSTKDYAGIGDAFIAWLDRKRLHFIPKADPRKLPRGLMDWHQLD